MLDTLIKQLKQAEGITEQLKTYNQTEWSARMNDIRNRTTEIVNHDIIFNGPKMATERLFLCCHFCYSKAKTPKTLQTQHFCVRINKNI